MTDVRFCSLNNCCSTFDAIITAHRQRGRLFSYYYLQEDNPWNQNFEHNTLTVLEATSTEQQWVQTRELTNKSKTAGTFGLLIFYSAGNQLTEQPVVQGQGQTTKQRIRSLVRFSAPHKSLVTVYFDAHSKGSRIFSSYQEIQINYPQSVWDYYKITPTITQIGFR